MRRKLSGLSRLLCLLLCLAVIFALTGCGKDKASGSADAQSSDEKDVLESEAEKETAAKSSEGIDIDLTELSSTMVYSEVYNMMASPDEYKGKTVKMAGSFARYHDENTNQDYFACIIQDATACCSQGIEFNLSDDYKYPDDYPEEGGDICVVGVFDTYQEGDYTYCTLRNARLA